MATYDEHPESAGLNRTQLLAMLLNWAGGVLAVVALVWAAVQFWQLGRSDEASAVAYVSALATLALNVTGAMLAWGAAEALRRLSLRGEGSSADASPLSSLIRAEGAAGGSASGGGDARLDAIVAQLRELRELTLLSDAQRAERLEVQARALAAELERDVPALLREHRWREAGARVQEARLRFPAHAVFEALERQVQATRDQIEAHDVAQAERQVHDLSSLQAWERAADVVRELLERHPDSQRVNALAHSVRQKYEQSQAEQRARLMAQAQAATSQRDWHAALHAAQSLIERFPRSPEAESLRTQLETLRANAEIQTRQKMESQIREFIKQHRYEDALQVANELIDRYPNSPQSDALRSQLPKLQEKAALVGPRY